MQHQSSLADLLKLLLCLGDDCPVYATPSFSTWLRPGEARVWPPPADADNGLLLVDTRDPVARRHPSSWVMARDVTASASATLVLVGSGAPGSMLRKLLRRFRRPGMRRLSETRARQVLAAYGSTTPYRWAFDDGPAVPTSFDLDRQHSTGAAILMSDLTPFKGSFWELVAGELGADDITVTSLHLRARGAAVALVRAGSANHVLRVVPAGALQDVVVKNHSALSALRRSIGAHDSLLRRIPIPAFSARYGTTAVMCETRLPGVLAWKVARGALERTIRYNAHAFLATLRTATTQTAITGRDDVRRLLKEEQARLDEASFASHTVRRVITQELTHALKVLDGNEFALHASHGDFGYGNILVSPATGELCGVIDWDTSRALDLPGIDRVNLEIQILRTCARLSFPTAVAEVWKRGLAADALDGPGPSSARSLFGLAVCRYVTRAFSYPALYRAVEPSFERALKWLERT